MSNETFVEKQEEHIVIHTFSVSAAMVGVCLTCIGIINIIESLKKVAFISDEITAIDSLFFLFSCIISYFAIKTKERKSRFILEKIADYSFLMGMIIMTGVCVFIGYCFI